MRKNMLRFLAILLICILVQPSTACAEELVTMPGNCTLKLEYSREGTAFEGLEIAIYRVAAMYEDGSYALTGAFSGYPVKIHDIRSQLQWREAANTLAAYAQADGIAPAAMADTDESGNVTFSNLETGLYLVREVIGRNAEGICQFENFIVFLPTPQTDGTALFDVSAKPKSTVIPEEPAAYQVVKLWKDTGNQNQRPTAITVDILKNGQVAETVILSAENNWSYAWSAPAGDTWTVVERDVPEGYTVTITENQTLFTITNTGVTPDPEWPQTGDTFHLRLCILLMSLSGIGLVALGIWRRRQFA